MKTYLVYAALLAGFTSLLYADVCITNKSGFPIQFQYVWKPTAWSTKESPVYTLNNGEQKFDSPGDGWLTKSEYRVAYQEDGVWKWSNFPVSEGANRFILVGSSPNPDTGRNEFHVETKDKGLVAGC